MILGMSSHVEARQMYHADQQASCRCIPCSNMIGWTYRKLTLVVGLLFEQKHVYIYMPYHSIV